MNRSAIEWAGQFLKCDAEGCDHKESVSEITADLIGKPCPKCGANLLTKDDFESGQNLVEVINAFNKIFGPVDVPEDAAKDALKVSLNPHNGGITIQVKPQ